MIVLDSSALIAILYAEPEAPAFLARLGRESSVVSAATVYETEVVVLRRSGPLQVAEVRRLLTEMDTVIQPFDDIQALAATVAYARYGKGRHAAGLNLMDCAAYALARSLDAPLMFKGDDFARTDVTPALHTGG